MTFVAYTQVSEWDLPNILCLTVDSGVFMVLQTFAEKPRTEPPQRRVTNLITADPNAKVSDTQILQGEKRRDLRKKKNNKQMVNEL